MPRRINTSVARICNAVWGGLERETDRAEISDDSNCNYRVDRSKNDASRGGGGGAGSRQPTKFFFPRFRDLMSSFYRIVKIKVRVYRNKYIG